MIARTFAIIALLTLFLAGAASGGLSIIHSLLWVTYERKLLKKYGLDLEYIAIENGSGQSDTGKLALG